MGIVQVKLFYEGTFVNCERKLNEELAKMDGTKIRDVRVDCDYAGTEDHYLGVIIYEK